MLLHLSSFSEGPFVPSISRTVLKFLDSRNLAICYRPAIQTSQWQASVHFDPEQQPGGEAGHCNPFRAWHSGSSFDSAGNIDYQSVIHGSRIEFALDRGI